MSLAKRARGSALDKRLQNTWWKNVANHSSMQGSNTKRILSKKILGNFKFTEIIEPVQHSWCRWPSPRFGLCHHKSEPACSTVDDTIRWSLWAGKILLLDFRNHKCLGWCRRRLILLDAIHRRMQIYPDNRALNRSKDIILTFPSRSPHLQKKINLLSLLLTFHLISPYSSSLSFFISVANLFYW